MFKEDLPTDKARTPAFTPVTDDELGYFGTDHESWDVLKRTPVAPWFKDAKFGIFIHWGGYSVYGYRKGGRGYSEHTPKMLYREKEHYYPHWKGRFGEEPPAFGYKDLLQRFKAEKWDPEDWAQLFDDAGAKYVILTGEHHDGYCLWDSELTPWTATKVGPMRDLVGDLCNAVRSRGMKFAPSYHRERHPGFFAKDEFVVASEPMEDIAEEIKRMPDAAKLYGPFVYDDEFIADFVARWKELEDKYQPDFCWFDGNPIVSMYTDDPQMPKYQDAIRQLLVDYVERAKEWGKDVYWNNKGNVQNYPDGVGCKEKDNLQLKEIGPVWQSCTTMGSSYGYLAAVDEHESDAYPSSAELIHKLCDIVSKNGNFLLNIGPRGDGTIPSGMRERLLAIGQWLKVNGDAIYGSRVWQASKQDEPKIRFTCKGDIVNVILLDEARDPFCVSAFDQDDCNAIETVTLLGSDEKVSWDTKNDGLRITPPTYIPTPARGPFR